MFLAKIIDFNKFVDQVEYTDSHIVRTELMKGDRAKCCKYMGEITGTVFICEECMKHSTISHLVYKLNVIESCFCNRNYANPLIF